MMSTDPIQHLAEINRRFIILKQRHEVLLRAVKRINKFYAEFDKKENMDWWTLNVTGKALLRDEKLRQHE